MSSTSSPAPIPIEEEELNGVELGAPAAIPSTPTPEQAEELDADEAEFRAIRQDLPGVKGAGGGGIVAISVGKIPTPKNSFFRTHRVWRPVVPVVDHEVGIEKQFYAVNQDMVANLAAIGITATNHVRYLTVISLGAIRIIPVRQADGEGAQDEYSRTKEIGLVRGIEEWVRLYADQENRCYKVFPAPADRFGDPHWPELKEAKNLSISLPRSRAPNRFNAASIVPEVGRS